MAEFCIKHDLIRVVDQAFEDTIFEGHKMLNMAQMPGMWERTVTVCSASKGMGLSGFRVGWTYADDVIMGKMYASAVSIQGAASTIAQKAVMPAFCDDSFIEGYLKKYENRRKYGYELFSKVPGVSLLLPEAGFYFWINVKQLGTSTDVANYLVKEALVNCNDGKFHGSRGDGYIRVIFAVFEDDKDCYAALDRMAAAFRKLAEEKRKCGHWRNGCLPFEICAHGRGNLFYPFCNIWRRRLSSRRRC